MWLNQWKTNHQIQKNYTVQGIIYPDNYNPGLVASYDIRPENGVGLFSEKKIKEKWIRKENTYMYTQDKKK